MAHGEWMSSACWLQALIKDLMVLKRILGL